LDQASDSTAARSKPLSDAEIYKLADKWVKEPGWFEFDKGDFIPFCKALIKANQESVGEVVLTKRMNGELVAVTRQDEEGQILKIIWEKSSRKPSLLDFLRPNYDYE
jgi:hypothetical protein